eukprot:m.101055 g.101055  ORF g.101055 m.101055 type:complete len:325 (+) comp16790_c0_seq2:254-1228(+)
METRVRRTTVFKRFSVTRDPPRPWRKALVNVGKMKLYRWQHAHGNKVTPITNNVWDPSDLVPRSPSPQPETTVAATDGGSNAASAQPTISTEAKQHSEPEKMHTNHTSEEQIQRKGEEKMSQEDLSAANASSATTMSNIDTSTTTSASSATVTSNSDKVHHSMGMNPMDVENDEPPGAADTVNDAQESNAGPNPSVLANVESSTSHSDTASTAANVPNSPLKDTSSAAAPSLGSTVVSSGRPDAMDVSSDPTPAPTNTASHVPATDTPPVETTSKVDVRAAENPSLTPKAVIETDGREQSVQPQDGGASSHHQDSAAMVVGTNS